MTDPSQIPPEIELNITDPNNVTSILSSQEGDKIEKTPTLLQRIAQGKNNGAESTVPKFPPHVEELKITRIAQVGELAQLQFDYNTYCLKNLKADQEAAKIQNDETLQDIEAKNSIISEDTKYLENQQVQFQDKQTELEAMMKQMIRSMEASQQLFQQSQQKSDQTIQAVQEIQEKTIQAMANNTVLKLNNFRVEVDNKLDAKQQKINNLETSNQELTQSNSDLQQRLEEIKERIKKLEEREQAPITQQINVAQMFTAEERAERRLILMHLQRNPPGYEQNETNKINEKRTALNIINNYSGNKNKWSMEDIVHTYYMGPNFENKEKTGAVNRMMVTLKTKDAREQIMSEAYGANSRNCRRDTTRYMRDLQKRLSDDRDKLNLSGMKTNQPFYHALRTDSNKGLHIKKLPKEGAQAADYEKYVKRMDYLVKQKEKEKLAKQMRPPPRPNTTIAAASSRTNVNTVPMHSFNFSPPPIVSPITPIPQIPPLSQQPPQQPPVQPILGNQTNFLPTPTLTSNLANQTALLQMPASSTQHRTPENMTDNELMKVQLQ